MTLRLIPSLSRLTLLLIDSETIPSVHTYSYKHAPKTNRFARMCMIFKWTLGPKGLRNIADVCPHPSLGYQEIILFMICTRKVYVIHHNETSL